MREYFCMAVDGRLEVLCFARTPRATRASCATSSRPSGLVALDLAQSCQHYVVRGFALSREPRKLQQSVAEVGKRPSIPRAAARCHRMFFLCFFFFFFAHAYFPASGQAAVTGVVPSPTSPCLQFLSRIGFSNPTARRFFIECS